MHKALDAIVVGAGPAGAAMATHLAESGRHVLLVDACAFPRNKVCGEFLSPRIWPTLRSLQVADAVRTRAIPLSRFELVLPHARTTEMKFQDVAAQPVAISRYAFDQVLVERARCAGAQVICGLRVRKVMIERGLATGIVGSLIDGNRSVRTWKAPLIIAADGRRSVVVRDTGRIEQKTAARRVGFKCHWRVSGRYSEQFEHRLAMHSLPGGYVGVCPVEDGIVNVCGVMPAANVCAARGAIDLALANWCACDPLLRELLQIGTPTGAWLTMPDVSHQRAHACVGGVLYVGDAQGTTEPVAGQGMTLALEGAQQLAALIAKSGRAVPDAALQAMAQRQWSDSAVSRRRRAALFGWLLEHPWVSTAAWRAAAPIPDSRRQVLRRAYSASMAVAARPPAAVATPA